jgi:hypothetical protein
MIVTLKEIIENQDKFKQCILCKNPVPIDYPSCGTCDSEYFVPREQQDFSHLEQELGDLTIELEL